MDNYAFENNMIQAVNENARVADEARAEKQNREEQKRFERMKDKRDKAIREIIGWSAAFFAVTVGMGVSWTVGVPVEVIVGFVSVFGFVSGIRVGGLLRAI